MAAGFPAIHGPGLIGAAEYHKAVLIVLAVLALLTLAGRSGKEGSAHDTSVIGLSIDCADAVAPAGFWSEILGRPVNPGADTEHATIDATDPASGPRLSSQQVPESTARQAIAAR